MRSQWIDTAKEFHDVSERGNEEKVNRLTGKSVYLRTREAKIRFESRANASRGTRIDTYGSTCNIDISHINKKRKSRPFSIWSPTSVPTTDDDDIDH